MWRSVDLPPVLPTLPHISAWKTAFVSSKNFNSSSVCDENKSPWLSALRTETSVNCPPENSLPASEGFRQRPVYWWWLCNYVILLKKRNFVTFQDVWWVSISITTHYNSIHMIINCPDRGNTWENTDVINMTCTVTPFRLSVWITRRNGGDALKNWRTTAPEKMRRRCVKRASDGWRGCSQGSFVYVISFSV